MKFASFTIKLIIVKHGMNLEHLEEREKIQCSSPLKSCLKKSTNAMDVILEYSKSVERLPSMVP